MKSLLFALFFAFPLSSALADVFVCETAMTDLAAVRFTVSDERDYRIEITRDGTVFETVTDVEFTDEGFAERVRFPLPGISEPAEIVYQKALGRSMKNFAYKLWFEGVRGQISCRFETSAE